MTKNEDPKPQHHQQQQHQQRNNNDAQKDRTVFLINFEERVTEDILYELFLQAGPIDSIVRKQDRNGQLIALITYKHLESVDYSIKLLNQIQLFGQRLKVQQSQQQKPSNSLPNTPTPQSNVYSRFYLRNSKSYENLHQQVNLTPPSPHFQPMPLLNLPNVQQQQQYFNQQLAAAFQLSGNPQQQHQQQFRSPNNDDYHHHHRQQDHHQSRRHHSQHQQQRQNRSDTHNNNNNRSRSPYDRRRR